MMDTFYVKYFAKAMLDVQNLNPYEKIGQVIDGQTYMEGRGVERAY